MENNNVIMLPVPPIPVSTAVDQHVNNMVINLGADRVLDELKRVVEILEKQVKEEGVCQAS